MKLSGILGISLIFIFFACSPQGNSENNKLINESNKDFIKVSLSDSSLNIFIKEFSKFYNAFKNKDNKSLNNYIDPEHGFLLIYSEGAMPQVSSTNDLIGFTTNSGNEIDKLVSFPELNLKMDILPKVDCNNISFYDKTGSYFSNENPTADQELWIYGNFNKNENDYFKKVANGLTFNVVITGHGRYGVEFNNNKLKVVFIDIRKPCNA
jgi:hypothetical protein